MRGWRVDLRGAPLFFFFLPSPSFQFAYHLLHLPLLTPEGPRGDFDLNRKSGVVCLKISSSLHSAGKTLELRLDSEAGLTRVQVLHRGAGFDVEEPKVLIKSQRLAMAKCQTQARGLALRQTPELWATIPLTPIYNKNKKRIQHFSNSVGLYCAVGIVICFFQFLSCLLSWESHSFPIAKQTSHH